MKKSIEEIKKILQSGDYRKVLDVINDNLSEKFDLQNKNDEQNYSELLKLRVVAKTLAGEDDQIILDAVWKEKHPSGVSYTLESGQKVNLLYKSSFDFNSDAYVNTIHTKNLFDNLNERSATQEIVKRTKLSELKKQLNPAKQLNKGNFIILKHPDLSAPMSYHILFYDDGEKDLNLLSKGINNVLNDSVHRGLKKLSFFPLGFNLVVEAKKEDKNILADELANKIAETIVYFYNDNKYKDLPEIYFNFVTVETMMCFDRVFYRWSKTNKDQIRVLKQLSNREKTFIEEVGTKNEKYINSLKEIFYTFDDTSPILILGETGSGKSYLAELIHGQSSRSSKNIVKLNCALIRKETINQYVFGWKKGSYSDAKTDGVGAIEAANGSTLFLDEVGYLEIDVQQMLLKFIEDGTYSRFGEANVVREANVRLLFGTNINIDESVKQGMFKADLYERIAKYIITLPALRERPEDIPLLVNKIIDKLNSDNDFKLKLDNGAIELLRTFAWPGNIRQLQFYLEKLYNNCRHKKISYVGTQSIKSDPPRDTLSNSKNPYIELESALKKILQNSKKDHSKIVEGIIEPILAKIYIEDLNGNKKDSSKLIGIDGTRGEKSTLTQRYHQYEILKDELLK